MFNSSPQPISLNPTAPPFTYKSNNVRSNSFSSSSSGPSSSDAESHTSSQGSLHTITTASSFHPTLPPKEFIPRSHTISLDSMHTLTAESSPVVASISSSDDQCSESHFSIGGTSNPSDTTFSTQDALAPKNAMDSNVEDLLLSMKYPSPPSKDKVDGVDCMLSNFHKGITSNERPSWESRCPYLLPQSTFPLASRISANPTSGSLNKNPSLSALVLCAPRQNAPNLNLQTTHLQPSIRNQEPPLRW
jgi:hypothetical protein